ncbi:sulfatase family protein [Tautonia plasticadhaerens]|uniref:Arylsulfatase n=1 Tax=Tautonia plasticadhaerens TaxID=2527974 RepID=A0A518GV17_9BACT|nr:sulfatase [Tautonia plasticadhaerens]QDV32427.1 Arylsulfatase precursor [Tautonia plasticadhaerens]
MIAPIAGRRAVARPIAVATLLALLPMFALPGTAPAGPPGAAREDPKPPNVVLIISDDHGWTDYGFMGHPHVRTPNLDRLAAESLTFTRGYVPSSLCCPSLATIITGLFPHQHKITGNDPPQPAGMPNREFYASPLFAEGREAMIRHLEAVPTLPALLARGDYLSFQSGKWWQGDYSRGGFTHGMTRGRRHGDEGLDIGRVTMEPIEEFIAEASDEGRPFFVWYAPFLPHTPHTPPDRLLEHYRGLAPAPVAKYWAMVEWFDETCGRLLDHLDERGLAGDTIVLYVADNGWTQDPEGDGFIRSKRSPYDAGLRTPIMVRWPGRVEPAMSGSLASSIDLAPTILSAAGLEPTPEMPGLDLRDAGAVAGRDSVFGACYEHTILDLDEPAANLRERWMVEGKWKLIVPAALSDLPAPQLYDLSADPAERDDRSGEQPGRVEAMRRALDAWWDSPSP